MLIKRLQLGLLHMAVAMTLVPMNSTLNRVMIKELAISATLVAFFASLPYLFSPIQVAIGSFADRHPILGWRRTPYIALGLILCVVGVMISPGVAFELGERTWLGILLSCVAFGAWGMGYNFATVSYLSLASELSGEKGRSRTIAIMFFMMISSIIATAIIISRLVEPYSPEILVRAFQIVGLTALLVGVLGLIGLEPRSSGIRTTTASQHSWLTLYRAVFENRQAALFFIYMTLLLAAILGQDVLLEPFGGEAFDMPVHATTRITSVWGVCVLFSMLIAGGLEGRVSKRMVAQVSAMIGIVSFLLIALSGVSIHSGLFFIGVILLGLATGLSTVSNLSLMLDMTTAGNVGLFIGAWGMASAFARLVGSLLGGIVRDVVTQLTQNPLTGYVIVFSIEGLILLASLVLLRQIDVGSFRQRAEQMGVVERAALVNEA